MRTVLLTWLMVLGLSASAQERAEVMLETSMGNLRIALYNETPLHRDNFLRLCESHAYDSVRFHRVIRDFMVQGGDTGADYTIEAEIHYPQLFHRRGVIAAAREGDDTNPERRSSGTQFYLVWGRKYSERAMEFMESRMATELPPAVREAYMTVGGTPHLDGQYTVFGEILEGLDVVERIQAVPTNEADCPVDDVLILRTSVLKRP